MPTAPLPVPTKLEVNGAELSRQHLDLLTSMRVETAVNLVGRLTLRFSDSGYQLSTAGTFRTDTKIRVTVPSARATLFEGDVRSLALDHSAGHVPELIVTAEEPTWKLAADTDARTFEQVSAQDVISTLVSDVGLGVQCTAAGLNEYVAPHILKIGSSLAFLDELVRTNNAMWWFEAPDKVHVGPVGPITQAPVRIAFPHPDSTTADQRLLTFSVKATAAPPAATSAAGWNPKTKREVVANASERADQESTFVGVARASAPASSSLRTNAGGVTTMDEATGIADSIHTSMQSDAVTGRGTALADPRIRAGVLVEVTGVGPSSGRYLVTRVEHLYDRRGFHTTFHTGSHRPRTLVDTLGGGAGRPEARMDGILVAVVTNVKDPDSLGRVRVRFPSLEGQNVESGWARVATFDAGNDRGATFLPEVDDEVLVGFEDGSLRRPVVLGSLYGGMNKQPQLGRLLSQQGKVNTRRLTSRSGHALEMVDDENNRSLLIKHGTQPMLIKLDESSKTLTVQAQDGDLKLTNGQASIVLAKNGDITLEGTQVTLKARSNLSAEASGNVTVKGNGTTTVEGSSTTVKGQGQATLQGASTAIKGATVAIN